MNTRIRLYRSLPAMSALACLAAVTFIPLNLEAQDAKKKNPTSKLFVADVEGETQINQDDKIQSLNKKTAYNAEGSIIETKPKATNAMVYSNGTGIYFDPDTRVEVMKFIQEPFTPNRNDMEVEPSISQTDAIVSRGTIGLCTSKLVAGSAMKYRTSLGSVNIRGGKAVIQAEPDVTIISMLEGEGTVRGGTLDLGGQIIHPGEQATIRPGKDGEANIVKIDQIPAADKAKLEDKVFMACTARKTVYFEVASRQNGDSEIVTVPVVPVSLPVPVTVSPAKLPE